MVFMGCRLVTCLLFLLAAGCATSRSQYRASAPAVVTGGPNFGTATATRVGPPAGDVQLPPAGCISITFIAPGDTSREIRRRTGHIDEVITPSGKREKLLAIIEQDEVGELVDRIHTALTTGDLYALAHIPGYEGEGMIPGPAAWEYLSRYLEPTDTVWSFGDSDTGLAVIRDNHLFCIVVVGQRAVP